MTKHSWFLRIALLLLVVCSPVGDEITSSHWTCFAQKRTAVRRHSRANKEIELDGDYLKAFNAAFSVFEKDPRVPENKRNLENYFVTFRETAMKLVFRLRQKDFQASDILLVDDQQTDATSRITSHQPTSGSWIALFTSSAPN